MQNFHESPPYTPIFSTPPSDEGVMVSLPVPTIQPQNFSVGIPPGSAAFYQETIDAMSGTPPAGNVQPQTFAGGLWVQNPLFYQEPPVASIQAQGWSPSHSRKSAPNKQPVPSAPCHSSWPARPLDSSQLTSRLDFGHSSNIQPPALDYGHQPIKQPKKQSVATYRLSETGIIMSWVPVKSDRLTPRDRKYHIVLPGRIESNFKYFFRHVIFMQDLLKLRVLSGYFAHDAAGWRFLDGQRSIDSKPQRMGFTRMVRAKGLGHLILIRLPHPEAHQHIEDPLWRPQLVAAQNSETQSEPNDRWRTHSPILRSYSL
ncbi:MAG: hypothetical protein M1820_009604 [Bogoriella megaspora]|nr:MAG: hypothetical protein M1820_009604 [Bogoriella megaspora]